MDVSRGRRTRPPGALAIEAVKTFLLLLAIVCLSCDAFAAELPRITTAQAAEYAGREVQVVGVVVEVSQKHTGNVFIDLDAKYPDNKFAAVILWRKGGQPLLTEGTGWLKELKGRRVIITGPVVIYKGRAQIHLLERSQVKKEG